MTPRNLPKPPTPRAIAMLPANLLLAVLSTSLALPPASARAQPPPPRPSYPNCSSGGLPRQHAYTVQVVARDPLPNDAAFISHVNGVLPRVARVRCRGLVRPGRGRALSCEPRQGSAWNCPTRAALRVRLARALPVRRGAWPLPAPPHAFGANAASSATRIATPVWQTGLAGSSDFTFNFATAWFPPAPGSKSADGLVVRVVECNPDHHTCPGVKHPEWSNAGVRSC